MIVSVDVYTKDVDAALAAFKNAIENGGTNVRLSSSEDSDSKELEHVNLMFDADHTSVAVSELDKGPFVKDYSDL